ncbi:MAG: ATP-binding protein [Bacillota bacterium]|nr:ATP-binding protein [Bacillota bacterium]
MVQRKKDLLLIGVSIAVITFLHYYPISIKWGIHEFYRRLYYIPIILAAFKFRLKGGIIIPMIIGILYAPFLFIYFGEINIAIVNQFLEIMMFLVVGITTGFLVESDFNKKNLLKLQIKKLTNLENYTRNILDSITNVVIATDKDFNIQSINKEGSRLFGLSANNMNKKLGSIFVNYQKIKELIMNVMENEIYTESVETSCRTSNDRIIDVKLLIYPLHNIIDEIEGVVIVLEDITEIRKLESQVRRAEKLSAVGELASGVAHEIRNPMGIIKTISQTINKDIKEKDINEEDINEGMEIIIHEIDRANKVIKELLDFAKPTIRQVKLYSLDKLIKEILLITTKYAQQHHVHINYTSKEDVEILLDTEKLKQGVINIVFNAIQAMPNGGNVNIELKIKENWAELTFEDNGTGIPHEKLEKIFEPFYTTKRQGTGLGLSITHRIIEEHKGYMEIESKLGKGTKIRINLPIRREEK